MLLTSQENESVYYLDIEAYQRLASPLTSDSECLSGLSVDEIQALADSQLATASQTRLDELLAQNAESQLSTDEVAKLDHLVTQVDQLIILKTRARYTLNRLQELAAAS